MNLTADERPNIVLITTDQQRWDTIHAAGNPHIFTPHLNWLADTGIRYTRAYTECPVCAPARATIMTGLPAYAHGGLTNVGTEPIRGRPTIPGALTAAGYETRAQGKMHFHPMRKKFGFETMELSYDYYRQRQQTDPKRSGSLHGVGQNEMEPVLGSVDENHTLTRWVVDRSVDFLETRDAERPFFLWTSISKPHPPFDPSAKFWQLYQGQPVPDPVYGDWSREPDDVPPGFRSTTAHLNNVHRFSAEQLAQIRRAYYACITEIDYNLGRLFGALRELELLRNTLIIFTSDHGEMLGDHHLGAKSVFFEGSAHIPLLIRPPGEWDQEPSRGTTCDALVGLQDIFPTCLAASGTAAPADTVLPGKDLLAVAANPDSGRARLFGQHGNSLFAVIDERWKYCLTTAGNAELLFDLVDDPSETRNLAPAQPERCRAMRQALAAELQRHDSASVDAKSEMVVTDAPDPVDTRRWTAWPGFHRETTPADLLH